MKKSSIRRKVTFIIFLAIGIVSALGVILIYFVELNLLNNAAGEEYVQLANILSDYISTTMRSEIENVNIYTKLPLWIDASRTANLKYSRMTPQESESYLKDMDKKWASAQKGDPFFWEYLENRVSVMIRDIVKIKSSLAEIFITDKYGGLVAASEKTSDFYQADEEWWKAAYNNGKGGIYISNIEFNTSSAAWVISVAAPFRDKDGSVIGICKSSISLERLFHVLGRFRIGEKGQAVLTDDKGRIIYYGGVNLIGKELFTEKEMKSLLSGGKPFKVVSNKILSDKSVFIAFSSIISPLISSANEGWVILISQEASVVFWALNKFIIQLGVVIACLIILAMPLGSFFGGMVAKPISDLHLATERIMAGDWDYRIRIKTGDEIEQFADTFSKMIADIKDKQTKLESFSRGLEEKVKGRTKELMQAQEATLNILEDLEETKKTLEISNRQLKQLDQLKSDFVSIVSHELKTPLSVIKEGVSLILDKVSGEINEEQKKILNISKLNIDRLARIIEGLLDISKIEAGKVELKRTLVDIADLVRETVKSFELRIAEKGLKLKLNVDKDAGKVYADPDRMAQVLINLIGNAIKFTSSGYIEVSCRAENDIVVCSVKDTGIGISREDIPRLFDKFQQFGRIAGPGEKGTGLGLSIVKGILEMHGGSISVASEPEKGSCFTFKLRRYTEESLFSEIADKAMERAAQARSEVSLVIVSAKGRGVLQDAVWLKDFHNTISDCSTLIKNTLRRQGDEVVNNDGDILVILADCPKGHCVLVQQRIEKILNKFLEEREVTDKLDIQYGFANFPDDGRTSAELIGKAFASIRLDRPAKA